MLIRPRWYQPVFTAALLTLSFSLCARVQAQDIPVDMDGRYNAIAWVQNAAEYQVLTRQTYRMALTQLNAGLMDRQWTADEVQLMNGNYQDKSPAIILDLDETVLDNSAYNARNVIDCKPYDLETWNAWCHEQKAVAIPGAIEFIEAARRMGVEVFFVTNRRDEVKESTIGNLKKLGVDASDSNVLTRNDDEGRGGDKVSRRSTIAEQHRIVLLIGDNLSDICSEVEISDNDLRNETANRKADYLGSRWILLPNPVYGSWERSMHPGADGLRLDREAVSVDGK
ncbi:MAG: HAD family acid phosphatase [Pirellulaceae bacterium]